MGLLKSEGNQDDPRYCFGLPMQSGLAKKRLAELAESLQVGAKGEESEQMKQAKQGNQGKRKEGTTDKPETSQ